jgi:hypothetical protein
MQGLIPRRTMTWAIGIWDLIMLVWLLAGVSPFNTVATVWLIGLGVLAVAWFLTRPRRPPAGR